MSATPVASATANPKKLVELQVLFDEVAAGCFELVPRPADLPDVEETGDTLGDNARLKAVAVMEATGCAAIADDTGLEVDALDGAPGVRSARFSGGDHDDDANVALLLSKLAGVSEPTARSARFRTVICIARPDGEIAFAEGVCEGTIADERHGDAGFGYDPVFVPVEGDGRTFAEMAPDEKNAISHRGRAIRAAGGLLVDFVGLGS